MTASRTNLSDFADALAARLHGTWTSEYQRHPRYTDQFPRTEQLWDIGHVNYIVGQYVLRHDAVLHGPDSRRLYVTDRPRYPHQFVVAPLAPDEGGVKPHHFDGIEEPTGIAVSKDPARAAAQVSRRLLPRYDHALAAVFDNAVVEPDPPHRPAPAQVDQVLTLTLYGDGALGAPYESVPPEARMPLYAHGFQYHPHQAAFLLPAAYGESGRALRVHAVVQQLTAKGIGVNLRHAAPNTRAGLPSGSPKAAPVHRR